MAFVAIRVIDFVGVTVGGNEVAVITGGNVGVEAWVGGVVGLADRRVTVALLLGRVGVTTPMEGMLFRLQAARMVLRKIRNMGVYLLGMAEFLRQPVFIELG